MDAGLDVIGSVLDYAVSAPQGISNVRTGAQTTDVPENYMEGIIIRRNNDVAITLYSENNKKVFTNRKPSGSNWLGWDGFVLSTDLDGINLTLAYTSNLISNGNPHLCIKDAIEKKKIPENKVVILNIQNGSEFWAIGKWHNWNPTYASFIIGGYGFAGIGQLYVNGNNKWMWKSDKSSNFVEV